LETRKENWEKTKVASGEERCKWAGRACVVSEGARRERDTGIETD